MLLGAGLTLAGIVGVILGRSVRGFYTRIMVFALSAFAIVSGLYIFVLGMDDYAMGILGQMPIKAGDKPSITEMRAYSPSDLKLRLMMSFEQLERDKTPARRIHFICPDGSKDVTVYNTPFGIYGVPKQDIVCNDGMKLVKYGR